MTNQNSALENFVKEWKPIADIAFLLWILKPTNSSNSTNGSSSLF